MADPPPVSAATDETEPRTNVVLSDADKDSVRALAASMSFVGVCLILFGVLLGALAAGALYSGFATSGMATAAVVVLVVAVAYVPAGWWTMSGGRSLSALVSTRGRDAQHLLAAVRDLRLLFAFARGVIIVQALAMAGVAGALVWCTLLSDKGGRCTSPWG